MRRVHPGPGRCRHQAIRHFPASSLRGVRLVVSADASQKSAETSSSEGKEGGRKGGFKLRTFKASDGEQHLGSSLGDQFSRRAFPGPPPKDTNAAPLRILPIGGLGEIGMNCMLVGCYDRYILIDAGLMFPDFSDLGMQKILPDTSFLHQWRDKIEALVITHGHEDHIGAMPWVVPALDPNTPIFVSSFVKRLVQKRLTEYSLYDESRFKTFEMNRPFQAGPFQVEPVRVTHSIPDCCGLIMRSDHGTIVHTGDWKIDETPVDGLQFDRTTFEKLQKEEVVLMMSDSTNVLSPGRTPSEKIVEESLVQRILKHNGKGRCVVTQFASNIHRLHSVKAAADASGRKICFVGTSLNQYLEAAYKDGIAPINPSEILQPNDIQDYDPNKILIVTTGSQAEPRAALSLAAREASNKLKILPSDLVLYSAKVIPGNETQVVRMLNSIAGLGATVVQGRNENLHVSGHAYQDELKEVLRLVKPQHFLPVHGEYSFLCEHARLAREEAGVLNCSVIRNGTMLGVSQLRSRSTFSTGESGMGIVGEVNLVNFYNDGGKGTGTSAEMALEERSKLAFEGIVVVALDIWRGRSSGDGINCRPRLTTRGMWTDAGELMKELHGSAERAVARLDRDAGLPRIERVVIDALKRTCWTYNNRKPEVICIVHEMNGSPPPMPTSRPPQEDSYERPRGEPRKGSSWEGGIISGRGDRPSKSKEERPVASSDGEEVADPASNIKSVVKALVKKRVTRRAGGGEAPTSGLSQVPAEALEERKLKNPRDQEYSSGEDLGYD